MVRAIVGVHGHSARPNSSFVDASAVGVTSPTSHTQSVPDHSSHCDEEVGGEIEPPARSLGWASTLLALCCHSYGQPVEGAVPVGACLELLGIAAVALDVAQDGHDDLLCAYGAQPSCSWVPRTEAVAGLLVDPLSCSTAREISIAKQQNWGRSAALVSNASVALIALFWQALLEHGPRYGVETSTLLEIGRLIAERLVRICHGQHVDLTASCTGHLSLEEYDRMIEGKTGEMDGLACEAGAVLAGAGAIADRHLWRALGVERAVAQQLYDDYVDLAEDLAGGGQISHPVLYGLEVADDSQKETILTLLDVARSGLPGTQQATQQLRTVLSELGAEYYTLTCMVVRRKRALAALEALHMPQEAQAWLYRWVQSVDPLYSHAVDSHVPWS